MNLCLEGKISGGNYARCEVTEYVLKMKKEDMIITISY